MKGHFAKSGAESKAVVREFRDFIPEGLDLGDEIKAEDVIFFDHIDGMYSLCFGVDPNMKPQADKICHMAAWTEVEIIELDEILNFEQIRQMIGRSGYGKDFKGPHRSASLCNMSDDWVKASIEFVPDDFKDKKYYEMELEYRKERGISISEEEGEALYEWS